jgi:hypothetical protein
VSKGSASPGLGSLLSGAVTATALAVQAGLGAIVGVILAREFGRGPETDGFFAAYGVFVVAALAATAVRVAVLPPLARARADRRLSAETAAYGLAMATVAIPALVVTIVAAEPIADVLTGVAPPLARETAADALPWMVAAALLQLYAGLLASALASLDSYFVAAVGFALGSLAGLAYILVRVDSEGVIALPHGMAVNGVVALAVPLLALMLRARSEVMPRRAVVPRGASLGSRLADMGRSAALPLAMQALVLVCIPLAEREGVGAQTSFGYAYLLSSAFIAVTASSLGLVTSVPLTRAGIDPPRTVRHVVSSSWLALAVIGAAAGVFALAGEPIVRSLLGDEYGSDVGTELGRLVVLLSLWAVASIGFSVTFPLLFVVGRGRGLPLLAVVVVAVHVPIAWLGQMLGGLDGLALSLALTTWLALAAMLARLGAVVPTVRGLLTAAAAVAAIALLAFAPPGIVLEPVAAAAAGLALYAVILATVRPPGLRAAWRYLRALT